MTAYLLADHLLNFISPAACLTLLLMLLSRVFSRFLLSKRPAPHTIHAQAAIIFVANVLVLTVGLVVFKNDGKMTTYIAMVLVSALSQWALWHSWKS